MIVGCQVDAIQFILEERRGEETTGKRRGESEDEDGMRRGGERRGKEMRRQEMQVRERREEKREQNTLIERERIKQG